MQPKHFRMCEPLSKRLWTIPSAALLCESLLRARKAAISVCDITRPAPNQITLPPLLERLDAGGITRENIFLFIATGLHRPASRDELDFILVACSRERGLPSFLKVRMSLRELPGLE